MSAMRASAAVVGIIVLALLETSAVSQLPLVAFHTHLVVLVLLVFRHIPLTRRIGLAAVGGFILDSYSGLPFGTWMIANVVALLVPDLVFRQWLSHHSWIAPWVSTMTGWVALHLIRLTVTAIIGLPIGGIVGPEQVNWLWDDFVVSVILASLLIISASLRQQHHGSPSSRLYAAG